MSSYPEFIVPVGRVLRSGEEKIVDTIVVSRQSNPGLGSRGELCWCVLVFLTGPEQSALAGGHGAAEQVAVGNEPGGDGPPPPGLLGVLPVLLVHEQVARLVPLPRVVAAGEDLQHPVVVDIRPVRLEALPHPGVHHHGLDVVGVAPGARLVVHEVDHDALGPQLRGHDGAVVVAGGGAAARELLLLEVDIRTLGGDEPLPVPVLPGGGRGGAWVLKPDQLTEYKRKEIKTSVSNCFITDNLMGSPNVGTLNLAVMASRSPSLSMSFQTTQWYDQSCPSLAEWLISMG